VLFEVEELNEAIEQAVSFGYQKWAEITMMF
jgi:hypothetical protein